jgi:RNA polymerase sigma factor (sigma-70 family)
MTAPDLSIADEPPNRTSAEGLFRSHSAWLLAYLKRRFGAEAAEEIAQETFARRLDMDGIRNPRAFLTTLALRAAADQARREQSRPVAWEVDEADAAVLPDQLERVLLQQLLRELPRPVREVYLLCRVAGFTYPEAAERLGISVKRVEARMTEAHKRFAALLRD